MKKLLLCLLATFSLSSLQASEANTIDTFISTQIKPLSPSEIQFFANMVYLSYALAAVDSHVRDTAQDLLEHAWNARQAALQYTDTTIDLIQLQIVAESLDHGIQTQLTILKSWKLCTTLLDQLDQADPLTQAVEIFRKNVEQEIKRWAADHKNEFNAQLHQSSVTLSQAADAITLIADTYNDATKNDISASQTSGYEDIAKIINASKAAYSIEEQCENAFTTAATIARSEVDMQRVSAEIFLMYYQATYQIVQELESKYRTIVFNDEGIIPVEKRCEMLPAIGAEGHYNTSHV